MDLAAGTAQGDAIDSDKLVRITGAVGTSEADALFGSDGADQLIGGLGDDSIDGRGGDDVLKGGASKPRKTANDGADLISGGPGNDDIAGGYGVDTLKGDDGDDTLASDWKRDTNPTAEVGGTLSGDSGDDTLVSGPGNDSLDGGPGNDLASFENAPAGVTVDLGKQAVQGDGIDQLTSIESAKGTPFTDQLVGSEGPNSLDGVWGSDIIRGLGGDDELEGNNSGVGQLVVDGGDGNDLLVGGAACFGACGPEYQGRGSFYGGAGDDVFRSAPSGYTFDGDAGNDTAAYDFFYGDEHHYIGTHVDLASGQAWINDPKCPEGLGCFVDTLISVENADGGRGQDELLGDDGANVLRGFDDDDVLRGFGGNDSLDGGDGNDALDGGPGDDVCSGESTTDCEG
ncbi:MAG: hypothetical protein M3290_07190 [Actinomycetota bacterium]|nr:hypothetical protein [Actinomycetota bacterium]